MTASGDGPDPPVDPGADTVTPEHGESSAPGVIAPASVSSPSPVAAATSSGSIPMRGVGPGDRLGRYELGDELGQGGMATVFRARDSELRREVAVKVLFPHLARKLEITRRFQREARAAAVLEHPNILRVYDVGASPGTPPFIVMELVRGASLREVAEAQGPMLAELVACFGALVCDALAIAHAAGVIHRDVKPGNIMLSDDGRLLLADFGVARLDDDDSLVTRSGALLGTPSFMAPEQALGNPVDGRSDLYSVGASLYQLATGSLPFAGPTAKIVAEASRGGAMPAQRRRPAVGSELSKLIERMMAPDPAKRPASAAEAAAALRALAAAGGFGDPADEVRGFAADRAGWSAARTTLVVDRLLSRAREVRRRALPQSLSLVDRALALEPQHEEAKALADELQAPSARRWVVVGLAAGALGLAAAGVWMMTRGEVEGAAADAMTVAAAETDAATDASTATATDAATATATATDAATGTATDGPLITLRPRDGGPRPATSDAPTAPIVDAPTMAIAPPIDAPTAPPIDAPPAAPQPGRIAFVFDTWCDLVIDGEPRGRADRMREVRLAPGRHEAICSQGAGLSSWSQTIEVTAGEVRRIEGTLLRPVEVVIDAGDRVRIGTASAARGETLTLRPGRYRVEITTGSHKAPPVYVDIPRVARCTLRSSPRVDCYRNP